MYRLSTVGSCKVTIINVGYSEWLFVRWWINEQDNILIFSNSDMTQQIGSIKQDVTCFQHPLRCRVRVHKQLKL